MLRLTTTTRRASPWLLSDRAYAPTKSRHSSASSRAAIPVEFHQIAEHDREIAALADGFDSGGHRCRGRGGRGLALAGDARGCPEASARLRAQVVPRQDRQDRRGRQASPADARAARRFPEVLVSQMGERRDVNSVLGKPLRVLAETKLFEPVRNLLHCAL